MKIEVEISDDVIRAAAAKLGMVDPSKNVFVGGKYTNEEFGAFIPSDGKSPPIDPRDPNNEGRN